MLDKIYSSCEPVSEIIGWLLGLYRKISGIKEKRFITSGKFDKLATIKNMLNENLSKHDFGIIFKTCGSSDSRSMSFI